MIMLRCRVYLCLFVVFVSGCRSGHEQLSGKQRFLSLAQNGFKGGRQSEIESAFRSCFREGDMLHDYEDILGTAKRVSRKNGAVFYVWEPGGAAEGDIAALELETTGDPPYVVHAHVSCWLR
jgi:hypothetical protein